MNRRGWMSALVLLCAVGLAPAAEAKPKKKVVVESGGSRVEVDDETGQVEVRGLGALVNVEGGEAGDGEQVVAEGDEPVLITGNSRRLTLVCKPNAEVMISGNANKIALTGPCAKVNISGNSQVITIESAGEIAVTGNSNRVAWRTGLEGKKPKITQLGNANKVSQRKGD